jgi:predicted ATPase/transcriptional regulator with XRE-family HTH domain
MTTPRTSPVGTLLKRYRAAAGLTQEELAGRTGVSARTICDLERGVTRRWRHDTISLLAEALQLSAQDQEAFELAARRRGGSSTPAVAALGSALPRPAHNLPPQLTPLLGRERDEAAVVHLLRQPEVRLLTLTGPPGVGKTRLAVQVASGLAAYFAHGVGFVSLAAVRDPALVLPALAQALGLRETGGQPLAAILAAALADRHLLLVLDNFEQVLAAAPQLTQLLAACVQVQALVTSRAVLHVRGEYELVVPPLALPDPACLPAVDDLGQYAAVALFTQRARAVKPTFALTPDSAPAVAALCRRLDGLPLAIELAAARSKLFGPEALLVRLDRRLTLLTGVAQDLPPRQQTLRQALDWSHDLLAVAEQVLLRRLAVFAGGWTLEAAEAICGTKAGMTEAGMTEVDRETAVLDGLTALVDQSLVQGEEEQGGSGPPRFALLETIREYAGVRLLASGEAPTIQRAHAAYYLALAERAEPELRGPDQLQWLGQLRAEHHNLQAALGWARDAGEVELGLRLAGALCRYWSTGGYFGEGCTWIEELLTLAGPAAHSAGSAITAVTAGTRAKALLGAAVLLTSRGVPQRLDAYLEESLALRRQLADQAGIAEVLVRFGAELILRGEAVRATELLEEGLTLYGELGDQRGTAEVLDQLAFVARDRGDYARAMAMHEEALVLRREVGDLRGIGHALLNLAVMASSVQRDYPRAIALYEEALTISRSLGNQQMIASVLNNLADIAVKLGDQARAVALLEESLGVFRDLGRLTGVATVLENMGRIACDQGDTSRATELLHESLRLAWKTRTPEKIAGSLEGLAEVVWAEGSADAAARLYGAAAALRERAGVLIWPADSPTYERSVAAVRTALGDEAFAVAWEAGGTTPLERVIADVQKS